MRQTWWKKGDWNALCDVCGLKRKSSELIERWDHLMVCAPTIKPGCWELRHPQELIRPIPDQAPLPWTRPEPTDQFIPNDFDTSLMGCMAQWTYAVPDEAIPDCAIPDDIPPSI